jgi:O-antigen/teichoic acid export membrane protein
MRVTGKGLLSTDRTQREPSLSRSGAIALSIRIIGAAGMLVCHVVLARSLGVSGFGEYAQAIAWMQVLCVFGKAGLDNASLRYVSEYMTKRDGGKLKAFVRHSTRVSLLTSFGLMAAAVGIVGMNWNAIGGSQATCFLIASAMIPLICLRQIQEASLRAVGRFVDSQISTAVWPLILFVLAAAAWQISSSTVPSPIAMCLHLVSVGVVSGLVYDYFRHSPLRSLGDTSLESCRKQWFNTATAFVTAELLIALKTRVCVAMAGMQLGKDAAGLYAAMERFSEVSVLGSQSLGLVIAPQFAALYAARNFPAMRKLMWQGQILGLAFTLPVALIVACFGDIVFVLLGPDFKAGYSALITLLVSACVASFAGPSAYVLQMTGHERTMLAITAACAICNVVLSLLLMPTFGILGLGISQIVTSLVWTAGLRFSLGRHPAWQSEVTTATDEPVLQRKEAA